MTRRRAPLRGGLRRVVAAAGLMLLAGAGPGGGEQGWTQTEREIFWNSPVGSRVMPYDLFVRLETAGGEGLFGAAGHMSTYGYLVEGANPTNPDGLPIGFARERDRAGRLWLGMSCAACHTASLSYRGIAVRVDGGAGLPDTARFDRDLEAALNAARDDPEKLARLAGRLGLAEEERPALRARLADAAAAQAARVGAADGGHAAGPGRADMAGRAAFAAGVVRPPGAPLRIMPLWNAWRFAGGMWDGSVPSAGAGPLLADAAQAMAGPGGLEEVSFPDLVKIGALVGRLQPPAWPGSFPDIDRGRAERGAAVFRQACAGCHGARSEGADGRAAATLVPVDQVGGDRAIAGGRWRPVLDAMGAVVPGRLQAGMAAWRAEMSAQTRRPEVLRAIPLAGVWSSAPYLHDGSVPSLAELLKPPAERAARFTVGGREFDPEVVGYPADVVGSGFVLDTTAPGNGAGGHDYGTGLPPEAKSELLEYLKTL